MKRVVRALVPAAALGLLALPSVVRAGEETIPLDRVPPAVLKAVKDRFPGARIKTAEKEVEDNRTTYELGLTFQGGKYDVSARPDGTILEVEKAVKPADLPSAVSQALKAKYPRGKIERAEEITRGDAKTYEVVVETADDKAYEVVLDPSGKILKVEEGDD